MLNPFLVLLNRNSSGDKMLVRKIIITNKHKIPVEYLAQGILIKFWVILNIYKKKKCKSESEEMLVAF